MPFLSSESGCGANATNDLASGVLGNHTGEAGVACCEEVGEREFIFPSYESTGAGALGGSWR